MAVDTDSFPYSDGVLETVSSSAWTRVRPTFAMNVLSNKVYNNSGASTNVVYARNATYASKLVYTQWKFDTLGAGWEMGGIINVQDIGVSDSAYDGYMGICYDNGGGTTRFEIYEILNGGSTLMGSGSATTINAGDIGKITHETGDAMKGYLQGSLLSGVGGTDSTYTAATVGIYVDSSTGGAWRLDDWEGGDWTAPGGTVDLEWLLQRPETRRTRDVSVIY